jgi:tetratricopeptide (TPR) repeat protein
MTEAQAPVCQPQPAAKPEVHPEPLNQGRKRGIMTKGLLPFVATAVICPSLTMWVLRLVDKPKREAVQQALMELNQARMDEAFAKSQRDQAVTNRQLAEEQSKSAKAAVKTSQLAEENTASVLAFLRDNVLGADHQKRWGREAGKNVTLRQAVDAAEPKVSEIFADRADRPREEASIRMILGSAYRTLGDEKLAIPQFERALALREALFGFDDKRTGEARNELAVVYRHLGRHDDASRLFNQDHLLPNLAAALSVEGGALLAENRPSEAELKLRECLTIRQKTQPDDWTTFDAKTMLGAALSAQKKYAAAEPLLLSGYEGMKQRESKIPLTARKARFTKALERLVRLYEIWGNPEQAARWRKELEAAKKL